MFGLAIEIDREIDRLNSSAPDGIHKRLRHVELEARGLDRFTRETPALTATTELPDWRNSSKRLWPQRGFGSLAAAFAEGMTVPPHPGANWGDPNNPVVQQQRRAVEREMESLGHYHEQAAKDEEDRINREERERFAAQRRSG